MVLQYRLCRVLGLVLLITAGGCSNDSDPDEPVVLGTPPDKAYLGVEYSYNFGAYGGDDILDFSLANAPSWLGFEDTTNKARTGVILRGVPGITGGRRGEADLGQYNRISVNATDGNRLGGNYFDVTVEHNVLTVEDVELTEGQSFMAPAGAEVLERAKKPGFNAADDASCLPPEVGQTGTYTATNVAVYDGQGAIDISDRQYETRPVVVAVTLAHPSVEPVTVGFDLTSAFACEAGAPAEECEYAKPNRGDAKPLEDFVANSGSLAAPPGYLQYTSETAGTLTFAPGKTTCFVRLEIIDDRLPELAENLRLELTDVREGLASLSAQGADNRAVLKLLDDEPTISFAPARIILSEGTSRQITAKLSEVNDTGSDIKFRVKRNADKSSADEFDYELTGASGIQSDAVTVEIPDGESEATFTVAALVDTAGQGEPDAIEDTANQIDDVLTLVTDVDAQFGRENYARAGDASTEVIINEWIGTTDFSAYGDFIPTGLVAGSFGELYIAGLQDNADPGTEALGDESGDKAVIVMLDRFGGSSADAAGAIQGSTGNIRAQAPKVAFSDRTDASGSERVLTRSLALGYTITRGNLLDFVPKGEEDLGFGYFQSESNLNGGAFSKLWEAQLGSQGRDELVDIQTNPGVGVAFGATTYANWPESLRQSYQGNGDIVLGRVVANRNVDDAAADAADEDCDDAACLAWARMIGSSGAERLAAAPTSGGNTIFASGETRGAIEPDKSYGGTELFFIRTDTGDLNFITQQYGTAEEDSVSDAAYIGTSVWTAGASTVPYALTSSGIVRSDTPPNSSRDPYVIIFTGNEAAVAALSIRNDNGDEIIHAIDGLMDYGIIGGATTGSFETGVPASSQPSAILAKISVAEAPVVDEGEVDDEETVEPGKLEVDWRYQDSTTNETRVIDVALSANGKVFALVEEGNGLAYEIIVLDDRGERLDR